MKKEVKMLLIAVLKSFAEGEVEHMNELVSEGDFGSASDCTEALHELYSVMDELARNSEFTVETLLNVRSYIKSFENWDEVISYEAGVNGFSEYVDEVVELFEN